MIVVDGQGNEYEATYPRRAKGLVKNGRARFIDENKICLACPPNIILEDNIMSEDIKNAVFQEASPAAEKTMEYILSRIDKIISNDSHIHEAIMAIQNMAVNTGLNNVDGDKARGDAIAGAVKVREATNQQMISLLEKMYDDLRPARSLETEETIKFKLLMDVVGKYPQDVSAGLIQKIATHMLSDLR